VAKQALQVKVGDWLFLAAEGENWASEPESSMEFGIGNLELGCEFNAGFNCLESAAS